MTTAPVRTRPGSVTLVVVLMWLNGLLEIIGGAITMIASGNAEYRLETGHTQAQLMWVGIIAILLGIITIALAMGLSGGSNGARIFVTLLVVLQIIADTWELATQRHGGYPVISILAIVFWLLILAMLWTSRASAFFHSR